MNFNTYWVDFDNSKNQTALFQIKLMGLKNPTINLVGCELYALYAYDEFIGFGPARAAHGYIRPDSYNLSKYIKRNELILTVEVLQGGINNYFTNNEPAFFGAEIIDSGNIIATTSDFKAYKDITHISKTQRYSFQRHCIESYKDCDIKKRFLLGYTSDMPKAKLIKAEGNKIIDRIVNYPTYQYVEAETIESGDVINNHGNILSYDGLLNDVTNIIGGFKYEEFEDKVSDQYVQLAYIENQCGSLMSDQYKIYSLGRNVTGFIELKINVLEDCDVYIAWDEILWDREDKIFFLRMASCNLAKWSLKAGEYTLKTFEPYTLQYARVVLVGGKAELEKVGVILYENPDADKLEFSCADKELELIYKAGKNSFAQNAVDVLTDCPSRERAGWLCDSYFSARTELLLTGENLVEDSFLQNYILSPQEKYLPEGMIAMCYPSDNPDGNFIPNWAMLYVIELLDYKKRGGKKEIIEQSKPKVLNLLKYFAKLENEYGLLEDLKGWVFVEWSKANEFIKGINFPSNMLYFAMLKATAELYCMEELNIKAEKIKNTILDMSWNGEFFVDQALSEAGKLVITDNITETCQYYAFYFGIATPETHGKLLDTLINVFGATRDTERVYPNVYKSNAFIGNFLRLDYLTKQGRAIEALKQAKDYFLYMAKRTLTLWEHDKPSASCNHGFGSYIINIMVQGLTGFVACSNKEAIFQNEIMGIDCEISIPIKNEYINITVKDGKRTITAPESIKIISM